MAIEELVGLQLAVGFAGTEPDAPLVDALRRLHAHSLVVFSRNFESPEQFRRLIRGLEKGVGRRLLVMVDHEGGRIIRFSAGVTRFADALTVGRTQLPEAVERQGAVEAAELKRLGISVNLAPCVDVLAEGCDPVIGDRSYGANVDAVCRFAQARIKGLQSHGVAACAKHFPGLGVVARDPHKTLPTIHLDWPAMDGGHLPPFRASIGAKVATIMSSHVCYPALGDAQGLPAIFSSKLIRGLLRRQMRYPGVVLTDDLEMGALRGFGSVGEAAVRAAEAGHDLFLICCSLAAAEEAFSRLCEAYKSGRLSETELEASAFRIRQLRENFLCQALPAEG